MFGEISNSGFWYFYPVGLTLKTPIPALILGLLGIVGIVKWFKQLNWECLAAFFIPFTLMISVMSSHINIGIRHISPVYPLFAVGATCSALFMIEKFSDKRNKWARYIPAVLLVWQIGTAIYAYPNYTNYFNFLTGKEPGKIMADSDLGWGQGLIELGDYAKENKIDTLNLSYFGVADECLYDLPYIKHLPLDEEVEGWIAISENNYFGVFRHRYYPDYDSVDMECRPLRIRFPEGEETHTHFRWLDKYEMKDKVAGSIRIYNIE